MMRSQIKQRMQAASMKHVRVTLFSNVLLELRQNWRARQAAALPGKGREGSTQLSAKYLANLFLIFRF